MFGNLIHIIYYYEVYDKPISLESKANNVLFN